MIRIGIVGYGNLGKGAELAVNAASDMELVGIFSRRPLTGTISGVPAISYSKAAAYQDKIDVMLLCGGSATDLAVQGPEMARYFTTVDSFDTHPKIPEYFAAMDEVAKAAGHPSLISIGWDPGLFSLNRVLMQSILPAGHTYTFWGKGVSQGHSDAIRRIPGVVNAKQYTMPKEEYIQAIRDGATPVVDAPQTHWRDCYVVAAEGADLAAITEAIVTMPNYFAPYHTKVHFISEAEFARDHAAIPHGGRVLHSGLTQGSKRHLMEFALDLASNPEFTSSVLVAYARAAMRLKAHGAAGCFTVLDIPPAYLSPLTAEKLRATLL